MPRSGVAQPVLQHRAGVGVAQGHHAARVALHVRGLLFQAVALVGGLSADLTRGGHLEALLGAALRLQLGHFRFLGGNEAEFQRTGGHALSLPAQPRRPWKAALIRAGTAGCKGDMRLQRIEFLAPATLAHITLHAHSAALQSSRVKPRLRPPRNAASRHPI